MLSEAKHLPALQETLRSAQGDNDPATLSASSPFLTILVPAYNEEEGLTPCVKLLLSQLDTLGVTGEILIVDDCSRDRTGAMADELAARDSRVRVCHHAVNRNIGGGFLTGVEQARGEWMILIPVDLGLEPTELRRYLEAAPSADIVVGVSTERGDYTWFRRVVSWVNIHLIQLLFRLPLRQFNFVSLYRVEVLRRIKIEYWRSAFFFAVILIKARALGYRLVEVEVQYRPRATGRATGANRKLIARTVRDMLRFWWRGVTGQRM